jgi:Xaa-Pro aminopeptidase
MNGKLVIKAYIALKPTDELGRQFGKWATVLTQHGLDYDRANVAATDFIAINSHLGTNGISATFVPYTKGIYL